MGRNALDCRSSIKIACAVSHMDEFTLDICVKKLHAQTVPFDYFKVVEGKTPMCASFNACLDFAWNNNCNLLFHTASDVMAVPNALERLLEAMDIDAHYLSIGKGFDIVNGPGAAVGLWVFNMEVFRDKYRFRDEFLQDMKLCGRVEEGTGKTRVYTPKGVQIGYHHPIWTSRDIYMKYRYSTRKYKQKVIDRYIQFFENELLHNPDNKVLQIGLDAIERSKNSNDDLKSKDYHKLAQEFDEIKKRYQLDGTEYYIYHRKYRDLAKKLLGSTYDCKTVEERQPTKKSSVSAKNKKVTSKIKTYDDFRYGSQTPPIERWERKWDKNPGKRILFYTLKDFSGSFYKWAYAVNRYTPYAARLVAFSKHQYNYPLDILYLGLNCDNDDSIEQLFDECDLIHIKDEYYGYLCNKDKKFREKFAKQNNLLTKHFYKPTVFTHYGGYARKFSREKAYRQYVLEYFDARVAMTPDLNYEWFNGLFIPHSIDVHDYSYSWKNGNVITHSPSTAVRKGTSEFNKAVERMGKQYHYEQIQNVSHGECVARKRNATIFFDQAGRESLESLGIDDIIGWYGNSALEAMVYGIPTIAHISDVALAGAVRAGKNMKKLPILNTTLEADGMYQTLNNFFALSPEERKHISLRTRQWVREFHSLEVNGQELEKLYDKLLDKSKKDNQTPAIAANAF